MIEAERSGRRRGGFISRREQAGWASATDAEVRGWAFFHGVCGEVWEGSRIRNPHGPRRPRRKTRCPRVCN